MRTTALLLLLLVSQGILTPTAEAQDSQYWTIQYGNRARLLGGTVVGSATDLSAVYYNPGLLALAGESELILAGTVYQVTNITVKDALGDDRDLKWNTAGGVPSLFAGEFKFGFLGNTRLGYSFLSRHAFDLRFQNRGDLNPDRAGLDPDLDLLALNLGMESRMSDYWAGLTWSFPVGEKIGVGISQFFSSRNQRTNVTSVLQAQADTAAGISYLLDEFEYSYWSLVWKAGIGAQLDPWRLGLTMTSPNVKISGSGKVGFDETVIATDIDGDGSSTSRVISDSQSEIPANWKTPFSVGLGVAFSRKEVTRLHVSAEWFQDLGTFTVLDTEPIYSTDSTQVRSSDVIAQMGSVFNYGFGVEHNFTKKVQGYASFRTDFSATDRGTDTNATLSLWDIYHFALGSTFRVAGSEFTLGAIYSTGSAPTSTGITLIPEDLQDQTPGEDEIPEQLDARFTRLTFVLGFSLSL